MKQFALQSRRESINTNALEFLGNLVQNTNVSSVQMHVLERVGSLAAKKLNFGIEKVNQKVLVDLLV